MKLNQMSGINSTIRCQRGFAVVYGLVVLLVASLTGVSLITMSRKDNVNMIDYGIMRTATVASQAALRAVEQQCDFRSDEVVGILNAYTTDNNNGWLLGTVSECSVEKRISFESDNSLSPSYSARIIAFNPKNKVIEIEGKGYGGNGGIKRSVGIYQLDGINVSLPEKKHALYVSGEARNFDAKADITGDVYFGGSVHFNGGANGSIFRGTVKTAASNNLTSVDASIVFNQNVFFQSPVKIQSGTPVQFRGATGFSRNVQFEGTNPVAFSNIYFNSTTSGNGKIDMNGNIATHSGVASALNVNGSLVSNSGTIDIESKVQISGESETPYTIDLSVIPGSYIVNSSTTLPVNVTTTDIQNLYDQKQISGTLWNGFLVVRVNTPYSMGVDVNTASVFNGKMILIVERTINCNGNWYKSGLQSVSLVYVTTGGNIQEMGSSGCFRGYIHVAGTGKVTYRWSGLGSVDGAIHHTTSVAGWQVNSGSPLKVQWNDGVMNELVSTKVVKTDSLQTVSSGMVYLDDIKIRPKLVGIYY